MKCIRCNQEEATTILDMCNGCYKKENEKWWEEHLFLALISTMVLILTIFVYFQQ